MYSSTTQALPFVPVLGRLCKADGAERFRHLKSVDSYPPTSATISCFITGTSHKFLLLHQPSAAPSASTNNPSANRSSTTSVPHNPTSPQTEEAIRQFMTEVFECWVKTSMSPFYRTGMEIKSPVFRQRVVGAGRKWL